MFSVRFQRGGVVEQASTLFFPSPSPPSDKTYRKATSNAIASCSSGRYTVSALA